MVYGDADMGFTFQTNGFEMTDGDSLTICRNG